MTTQLLDGHLVTITHNIISNWECRWLVVIMGGEKRYKEKWQHGEHLACNSRRDLQEVVQSLNSKVNNHPTKPPIFSLVAEEVGSITSRCSRKEAPDSSGRRKPGACFSNRNFGQIYFAVFFFSFFYLSLAFVSSSPAVRISFHFIY